MVQLTSKQKDKLLVELDEKMVRAHNLVGKYIFYNDEHNIYEGEIISTTAYEEDADVYITIKLYDKSTFSIPIDVAMELLDKGYHGDKVAYIEIN